MAAPSKIHPRNHLGLRSSRTRTVVMVVLTTALAVGLTVAIDPLGRYGSHGPVTSFFMVAAPFIGFFVVGRILIETILDITKVWRSTGSPSGSGSSGGDGGGIWCDGDGGGGDGGGGGD